jgi:dsDNA-binding SOS-regulon protein
MIILTRDIGLELTKLGLPELTIIRDDSGVVQLAGKECNKPIIAVSTIKVNKKLTKAERDIITDDYIMPMLTTHSKTLLDLIALSKDTTAEEALALFLKEEKEDSNTTYNDHTNYHDKNMKCTASMDNNKGTVCRVVYSEKSDQMSCHIATQQQDVVDMKTEISDGVLYVNKLTKSIKEYVELSKAVADKKETLNLLRIDMQITCKV